MEENEELFSDEDLNKLISEEETKEINQKENIDDSINDHINQMSWLLNCVNKKLETDKLCLHCNKKINIEKGDKLHVLQASNVEPGAVAFVSICQTCLDILDKKQKKTEDNKNGK